MSHSIVNEFVSVVRNDKDANLGGCLYYCLALYRLLKMNNADMTKFKIYQYGLSYSDNKEFNTQWINKRINGIETTENPKSDWHFFWEYDGVMADPEGSFEDRKDDGQVINFIKYGLALDLIHSDLDLTEEFCIKALNTKQWNSRFSRIVGAKILKENFDIDMSDINKNGY